MLKKRIIPVLLLKNGYLVQSKGFNRYQNIGNALWCVRRLSEWGADELIYLDITQDGDHDMGRDDLGHGNPCKLEDILHEVSTVTFMPITVGGRIRTIADIEQRLRLGADKVSMNTLLYSNPDIVTNAADEFGSQCVVASIDVRYEDGKKTAYVNGGRQSTDVSAVEWAQRAEQLGAGEILLNVIDRDGKQNGYDIDLINEVTDKVSVPVIAQGGAGDWFDFADVMDDTNASAVAAANIFHYRDQSVYLAKKYLHDRGYPVRKPALHEFK